MEKLERAKKAGFAGVIVISNTDGLINSSIDKEEHGRADSQLSDVALVVLTRTDGDQLLKALESAMQMKSVLSVEVRHSNPFEGTTQGDEKTTILYINGKALINTGKLASLFSFSVESNVFRSNYAVITRQPLYLVARFECLFILHDSIK